MGFSARVKCFALFLFMCIAIVSLSACSTNKNESGAGEPAGSPDSTQAEADELVLNDNGEEVYSAVPDRLFWKPPVGWVGDVMPFSHDGKIELFYLQDWRNDDPGFHPIFRVTTSNLIDYEYHGEAIPFSEIGKQDLAIGTGDVIQIGDTYHFFYTGHNWMFPAEGKPKEAVMHAVSTDLQHWTKIPEDTFYAPEGYEVHDFRDPFVLYNEDKQEYWMIVSARKEGVGGVLALFTSTDLSKWEVQEPLAIEDTNRYFMLECADIFKMGDYWYLIFSEFSDKGVTHYRMSKTLDGPWVKPEQDVFDGRGFYAAKTGFIGERRFLFGWIPTRQNSVDYMRWDWAGNMAVHELIQNSDGTLSVKSPEEIQQLFNKELPITVNMKLGKASEQDGVFTIQAHDELSGFVFNTLPATAKITGKVRFDNAVNYTGMVFGVSDEPERAYGIRFEPAKDRLRYDAAPKHVLGSMDPDIQVPIELNPNQDYEFTVIIENNVLSFYIEDKVALSTRIYKMPGASWGWYSSSGTTQISDLKITGY